MSPGRAQPTLGQVMDGCVVLVTAGAACLFVDAPPAAIFVLATLPGLFATPFMVAQRSMLPVLAERPEELTAANGTASTIESLAFFAGPALAAGLLAAYLSHRLARSRVDA